MNDDLRVLAQLDPARPADPDAHTTPAARAMLASVLATPAGSGAEADEATGGVVVLAARRRRVMARAAAVVGVAAALTVGAIVLPRGGGDSALASWTARPGSLSDDAALTAAQQCRDMITGMGLETSPDVDAMVPELAERRGDFRLVVISGRGWQAECLLDPDGGGTAGLSDPAVRAGLEPLGPEDIRQGTSSTVAVEGGNVASVIGDVGADVMAVTIQPSDTEPVYATVEGGHFAAFWPPTTPRSQHLSDLTATLVLRSGEVRVVDLGMD